ncbi:MAG: hypothetical protein ACKO7B_14740, partial [Flavobacteriales bacterium]
MQKEKSRFQPISEQHVAALKAIVGNEHVHTERDVLADHSHDYTEDLRFLPEVVVKPRTATEVA